MDKKFYLGTSVKFYLLGLGATTWTRTAVSEHKTEDTQKGLVACVFLSVFLVLIVLKQPFQVLDNLNAT